MVHVSNLDGYELPVAAIVERAHAHGARVLLDGAQSVPHRPMDVQALDVDFLAFSVHKLCGPTGVGVLYGKQELLDDPRFRPLLSGGDTVADTFVDRAPRYLGAPFRFEAGLQDYAGLIGAGAAIAFIESIGWAALQRHVDELNTYLGERLRPFRDEFVVFGPPDPARRNGISTLCFKRRGLAAPWDEDVVGVGDILNRRHGVMVRTGELCVHSWFNARRLGRERDRLRVSLYVYNNRADCDAFADALEHVLHMDEYRMLPRLA
jgi:cysteine desulfurase/selenocysteine lyase